MRAYVYLTSKYKLFNLKWKPWQICSLDDSRRDFSFFSEENIKGVLCGPR